MPTPRYQACLSIGWILKGGDLPSLAGVEALLKPAKHTSAFLIRVSTYKCYKDQLYRYTSRDVVEFRIAIPGKYYSHHYRYIILKINSQKYFEELQTWHFADDKAWWSSSLPCPPGAPPYSKHIWRVRKSNIIKGGLKLQISGKYFIIYMQNSTTTDILQIQSHETSSLN